MKHINRYGKSVQSFDEKRLIWYGKCSYWTDDFDKLDENVKGKLCCPKCGGKLFSVNARTWFNKIVPNNMERCLNENN